MLPPRYYMILRHSSIMWSIEWSFSTSFSISIIATFECLDNYVIPVPLFGDDDETFVNAPNLHCKWAKISLFL